MGRRKLTRERRTKNKNKFLNSKKNFNFFNYD